MTDEEKSAKAPRASVHWADNQFPRNTANNLSSRESLPKEQGVSSDARRHFQTIMKHTRYTQVDVGTYKYQLRQVFGADVDFALCAYRPRFERVPRPAANKTLHMRVAHLTPKGCLEVSEWIERSPSARRAPYDRPGACIFAFAYNRPAPETVPKDKGEHVDPKADTKTRTLPPQTPQNSPADVERDV